MNSNEQPATLARRSVQPAGSAYQRGYEQGQRDSGKRYTGGMGSGYELARDRDAYRAGYEAGWDGWLNAPHELPPKETPCPGEQQPQSGAASLFAAADCSALLERLRSYRAVMAPHHKTRMGGELLLEAIEALEWSERRNRAMREAWAEDHSHLQRLCREVGCSEFEAEGDSYGVPGIIELADRLRRRVNTPPDPGIARDLLRKVLSDEEAAAEATQIARKITAKTFAAAAEEAVPHTPNEPRPATAGQQKGLSTANDKLCGGAPEASELP